MSKTETKTPTGEAAEPTLTETVSNWQKWKGRIAQAQTLERKLRNQLITSNFKKLKEGANTVKLEEEALKIVATSPVTRKVDAEKLTVAYEKVKTEFGEDTAKAWFSGLFEYKPTLNLKNYRMLETSKDPQTAKIRSIVNDCITSKEGMPSLRVDAIKAK